MQPVEAYKIVIYYFLGILIVHDHINNLMKLPLVDGVHGDGFTQVNLQINIKSNIIKQRRRKIKYNENICNTQES